MLFLFSCYCGCIICYRLVMLQFICSWSIVCAKSRLLLLSWYGFMNEDDKWKCFVMTQYGCWNIWSATVCLNIWTVGFDTWKYGFFNRMIDIQIIISHESFNSHSFDKKNQQKATYSLLYLFMCQDLPLVETGMITRIYSIRKLRNK
jgi:hypothetical protein